MQSTHLEWWVAAVMKETSYDRWAGLPIPRHFGSNGWYNKVNL